MVLFYMGRELKELARKRRKEICVDSSSVDSRSTILLLKEEIEICSSQIGDFLY